MYKLTTQRYSVTECMGEFMDIGNYLLHGKYPKNQIVAHSLLTMVQDYIPCPLKVPAKHE